MALLGNYNIFQKNPLSIVGTSAVAEIPSKYKQSGQFRNRYYGECCVSGVTEYCSLPNGYRPPYSWSLAPKQGGMGSNYGIQGDGNITNGNLAGGFNLALLSPLSGSGEITNAALGLIASAVATLSGVGGLTADIIGKLEAVAALAGNGNITAAMGALAGCVADLIGSSSMSNDITAKGNVSADISPFTTLSPQNLAAAVWNALAAEFNTSGTMGNKMNSAGSSGDPWTAVLPASYASGTAGDIVGRKLLTTAKFLGLK